MEARFPLNYEKMGGNANANIMIMKSYSAKVAKIGINPYMYLPEDVLNALFEQSGKTKAQSPFVAQSMEKDLYRHL